MGNETIKNNIKKQLLYIKTFYKTNIMNEEQTLTVKTLHEDYPEKDLKGYQGRLKEQFTYHDMIQFSLTMVIKCL